MSAKFSMDDYVDVAERIRQFKETHPDGTLQTIEWGFKEVAGKWFVWYHAAAYRAPDDERPGYGIAWEPFPGATQFTRDSELMNAETAAWGRAIVACGFATKKIASRQEVQARQQEASAPPPRPENLNPDILLQLKQMYKLTGWNASGLKLQLTAIGVEDVSDLAVAMKSLTVPQAEELNTAMAGAIKEREKAS